jgi:phage major head subunit gpT-like protein
MSLDTASAMVKLRSLTARFDNRVKAAQPFYPQLCTTVPSTGADEEYGILGNVPQVREWIGDRQFKELRAAKWTIENKLWEQSLRIAKTDIADDRLGMYSPALEELGNRAAKYPDALLFSLINGGEAAACFDAQYFFDTDHAWGDSGNQSNDLTYNCSDHTNPTAAEIKAAYNAAVKAMMEFKDDQGEFINDDIWDASVQLVIVCNHTLQQVMHDALTVMLNSTGGENYVVTKRPTIITSAKFTSTVKFDVYKTDSPIRPFIFQAREPLSRQMKDVDDLEFKDVKFMTSARYNVGYGAWWTAVRTTLN